MSIDTSVQVSGQGSAFSASSSATRSRPSKSSACARHGGNGRLHLHESDVALSSAEPKLDRGFTKWGGGSARSSSWPPRICKLYRSYLHDNYSVCAWLGSYRTLLRLRPPSRHPALSLPFQGRAKIEPPRVLYSCTLSTLQGRTTKTLISRTLGLAVRHVTR